MHETAAAAAAARTDACAQKFERPTQHAPAPPRSLAPAGRPAHKGAGQQSDAEWLLQVLLADPSLGLPATVGSSFVSSVVSVISTAAGAEPGTLVAALLHGPGDVDGSADIALIPPSPVVAAGLVSANNFFKCLTNDGVSNERLCLAS